MLSRVVVTTLLIVTAVIGIGLLRASQAATPFAVGEPENGNIKAPAVTLNDAGASDSKAVRFGMVDTSTTAPVMAMALNGTMMYANDKDPQAVTNYMKAIGKDGLGAKWIRIQFNWDDIAYDRAKLRWSRWDDLVTKANANGMQVLGILFGTPTWQQPSGGCGVSYPVLCYPTQPTEFGKWAGLAAGRYNGKSVSSGKVDAWEIWNEPNCGISLNPIDPARYATLVKATYQPIKTANPNSTVLAGGSCAQPTNGHDIDPRDWLDAMYDNGAKGYFDALAVHPYCWGGDYDQAHPCPLVEGGWSLWTAMYKDYPSPNGSTSKDGRSLRTIVKAHGQPDIPFWLTEFGAPTKGEASQPFLTEANQRRTMIDAYNWMAIQPNPRWYGPLFWFEYLDRTTATPESENHYGLYNNNYTSKPAAATFRNLSLTGKP